MLRTQFDHQRTLQPLDLAAWPAVGMTTLTRGWSLSAGRSQ